MNNKRILSAILLLIFLLGLPGIACADMGLPMIFVTLPGMLIALVPVIAAESYIIARQLSLTLNRSLKTSFSVNLVSTIIGLPITWVVLFIMQMLTGGGSSYGLDTSIMKFLAVTWQAPWLIPYESDLWWMIPAATLTLLVPFFFASWFIEYQVSRPGEFHPESLSEPDLNLSAHPAPIIQPQDKSPFASV